VEWYCNIIVNNILKFAFGFFLDIFKAQTQIEIVKYIGIEFLFQEFDHLGIKFNILIGSKN
jgi:hypothetical protein